MEKDISTLLIYYFKKDFISVFLANWPILILDIYRGFPSFDQEEYITEGDTIFMICMLMKIFRIDHLNEIRRNANRIRDMLGSYFYM